MFSSTYVEARDKFINLATRVKFELRSYKMQQAGPNQEALSTDVAYFFPKKIRKLLILTSGVHGIEGYGGSAVQSHWLSQLTADDLTNFSNDGLGIVLIHAVNPHGFAYGQRVDRSTTIDGKVQNIDPNRCFLDFSKPLPANPGYKNLEDTIIPQNWSFWSKTTSTAKLLAYYAQDVFCGNFSHFSIPVLSGQYTSPDGFSFGGTQPSWANWVIGEIMRDLAIESIQELEKVVYMDWHTGIGEKGGCEVYPNTADGCFERVNAALNGIVGVKVCKAPYPVSGALEDAMQAKLLGKEVSCLTLELGTESSLVVLNALRAQACVNRHGNNAGSAQNIAQELRLAFYPENDSEWKTKVLALSKNILAMIFTRLLESKSPQTTVSISQQKITLFPSDSAAKQKERVNPEKSIETQKKLG